jgi:hypothetical protein
MHVNAVSTMTTAHAALLKPQNFSTGRGPLRCNIGMQEGLLARKCKVDNVFTQAAARSAIHG